MQLIELARTKANSLGNFHYVIIYHGEQLFDSGYNLSPFSQYDYRVTMTKSELIELIKTLKKCGYSRATQVER